MESTQALFVILDLTHYVYTLMADIHIAVWHSELMRANDRGKGVRRFHCRRNSCMHVY